MVIQRAINDMQQRVKRWWQHHPEADTDIALVYVGNYPDAHGYLYFGVMRLPDGELQLYFDPTKEQWIGLVEVAENSFVRGVYPSTENHNINSAVIAITGAKDTVLAKLLGTKPHIVKKWYTTDVAIPQKYLLHIREVYLHETSPK